MKNENVIFSAKNVGYYSQNDEAAFFEWLDNLACIPKYEGKGDTLYIHVHAKAAEESEQRDLPALFHRYKIDMNQLAVFDREEFASWFRGKINCRHSFVFSAAI